MNSSIIILFLASIALSVPVGEEGLLAGLGKKIVTAANPHPIPKSKLLPVANPGTLDLEGERRSHLLQWVKMKQDSNMKRMSEDVGKGVAGVSASVQNLEKLDPAKLDPALRKEIKKLMDDIKNWQKTLN